MATFLTDDGFKLVWDKARRVWSDGDLDFVPGGRDGMPCDCFGDLLPGKLIDTLTESE